MIILSSNYNWIYLSNLGRAHHPIEYTWPGRSVAIICHAFVMPLFKAEYDMRLLFYFVSLDRKNCLVDRCTKWYNIWSFFVCLKPLSCDSIYLPEVLFVHLSVSTKWVTSGDRTYHQRDLSLRGGGSVRTAWAASLSWIHLRSKIHEAKENF